MTVGEMIKALQRFDPACLLVIENERGDYLPMGDDLARVKIGAAGEHYHCVAVVNGDTWPSEDGGVDYVIVEE